ncbi:MAG: phosphatidylserine decarboxylase [Thermodesulfobacteriota bacterium]
MHQYVERLHGTVLDEELFGDRIVRFLYSRTREKAPFLFRLATSARISGLLGWCNFDLRLTPSLLGNAGFLRRCGVDLAECLQPAAYFTTPRRIFERQIRYWQCRPMPADPRAVVSPADARVIIGSLAADSALFLKGKFFEYEELLGSGEERWLAAFSGGDYAVFRLTPDKYHYNHTPVAGRVVDHYLLDGVYHSCNPGAVVAMVTPYSKNRRVVTIIDTDVEGGTGVGLVAMIEVVAMMIGDIVQCYSDTGYEWPQPMRPGMFVAKGAPKSLYRPGSSTDILLFQSNRLSFADDLAEKARRADVASRFSIGFGQPLAEVEVQVRSLLGTARQS